MWSEREAIPEVRVISGWKIPYIDLIRQLLNRGELTMDQIFDLGLADLNTFQMLGIQVEIPEELPEYPDDFNIVASVTDLNDMLGLFQPDKVPPVSDPSKRARTDEEYGFHVYLPTNYHR